MKAIRWECLEPLPITLLVNYLPCKDIYIFVGMRLTTIDGNVYWDLTSNSNEAQRIKCHALLKASRHHRSET